MSKQVYSAYQAIQLNNLYRRDKCCNIGNTMRWKNIKTGKYYCYPHYYASSMFNKDDFAYLIPVKGAIKRYA